jgi:hypothetical protein
MAHQKPRKNELRKEIAALIDSIKNQSDRIGTNREVPQVDIDLIIHSIEQLHRKAVVFSYLNAFPEAGEAENPVVQTPPLVAAVETPVLPVPEVKIPEPVVPEPVFVVSVVAPEPPKAEPVVPPVAEVKTPEPVVPEPVFVVSVVAPEPPKAEPVVPPVAEVKTPEPAPVAPAVVPEPPKAETIVPPITEVKTPEQQQPVQAAQPAKPAQPATGKDVRSMIGFNEKLMFLRSLFGGDAAAYDEALNHLNSTTSRDEAEAFITILQREYRWQPESEPAEMFRNLVNRRFS